MRALPGAIESSLIRGVASFLRATPANELPSKVRPLKSFRPAALTKHRDAVLGLLEDATVAPRIVDWLDNGKPPLKRPDRELLRAAATGGDGWATTMAEAGDEKAEAEDDAVAEIERLTAALEREKAKTKKARNELRRERELAETAGRETRSRLAGQVDARAALEQEVADLRRRVAAGERALEAERRSSERDLRRARKEAETAAAKLERAQLRTKELRKELGEARTALAKRPAKATRTARGDGRGAETPVPAGPRRPLRAPKGLLDDAPETLDAWLGRPDVHLVVDGYNVTKAEGGFGDAPLAAQRERLVDEVAKLARRTGSAVTVVFDGSEVLPGTKRRRRGSVKVEYSRGEIADDHIIALIERLPQTPVVLATNDKELQDRAADLGATVATSSQLLSLLRR